MPKRLLLRLGTTCNNGCAHCTIADLRKSARDRSTDEVLAALEAGRQAGCHEVVFLRGEPTIRPDIGSLCQGAREMGYGLIQLQSNGRMFSLPRFAARMVAWGMTHVEVSLYGAGPEVHDPIAGSPGAFLQTGAGIEHLVAAGVVAHANIPVVSANLSTLSEIVQTADDLGIGRIQFNFPRLIPPDEGGDPDVLPTLSDASLAIRRALGRADALGVEAMTEAVPLCHLGSFADRASDAWPLSHPPSVRIDDLHRVTEDLAELRNRYRAHSARCNGCSYLSTCPTTWQSYTSVHSDEELGPPL